MTAIMVALDSTIVSIALPSAALHFPTEPRQWVVTPTRRRPGRCCSQQAHRRTLQAEVDGHRRRGRATDRRGGAVLRPARLDPRLRQSRGRAGIAGAGRDAGIGNQPAELVEDGTAEQRAGDGRLPGHAGTAARLAPRQAGDRVRLPMSSRTKPRSGAAQTPMAAKATTRALRATIGKGGPGFAAARRFDNI